MTPRHRRVFDLALLAVLLFSWSSLGATAQTLLYSEDLTSPTEAISQIETELDAEPNQFVVIEAGRYHSCGLTIAGGVKCWGRNEYGQLGDGTITQRSTPTNVMGLSSGVANIAVGDEHTCALMKTGGVKCWGYGRLSPSGEAWGSRPTPIDVMGLPGNVTAITAGGGHNCALTASGGAMCWGSNYSGQLGDGTTTNSSTPVDVIGLSDGIVAIAAGGGYTCAITTAGGAKCWGANEWGRLGDGTTEDRLTPVDVTGLTSGIATIEAGSSYTCALTTSGGVKCWGDNGSGQLGDGSTIDRTTPVDVAGLNADVVAIAVQEYHTCALTKTGGVKCWGANSWGRLGDGTGWQRTTPTDVVGLKSGVIGLAVGFLHTCALNANGDVKCWGANSYGQLGDGTMTQTSIPLDVVGISKGVAGIAVGDDHTCALTQSGETECWGSNLRSQLGIGFETYPIGVPTPVIGLAIAPDAITAGEDHTCVLTATGGVNCWGDNYAGKLGDGTTTDRAAPVAVEGMSSGVVAVSAGGDHTCALTETGGVKCWGNNFRGQLGDGTNINRTIPVDVVGLTNGAIAVAAGGDHTCALTTSGGVRCWGRNNSGQLGNGMRFRDHNTPVDVVGISTNATAITAGGYHTCAVTEGGQVKCWGENDSGQLGDNTTTDQTTPVGVSGISGEVTSVSAGNAYTCALTSSGKIKCWGRNTSGQLGDGSSTNRTMPVEVTGLTGGASAIVAGRDHTCALTIEGRTKCWGYNGDGQLGLGTVTQRFTPVNVVNTVSSLAINYTTGQPGSYFAITGWNYPSNAQATVTVNNQTLTTSLAVNETGSFIAFLNTNGADLGRYTITASVNPSASVSFTLADGAPVRTQEGGGETFDVPAGIGIPVQPVYLPLAIRN